MIASSNLSGSQQTPTDEGDYPFLEKFSVGSCVQCGRCVSACLAGGRSTDSPRRVIRRLQWNEIGEAIRSPFLFHCKQCVTCTVRCPQGVDVANILRSLMRAFFLTAGAYEQADI